MSWQGYVDTNLVGTGSISQAAILGQQGGVWASSAGFTVAPQEQTALLKDFGDASAAQANGIRLGGVKYLTLQANDRSIYGKKGGDGVVCVKTKQTVIVGVYKAGTMPGEATKIVEGLGDYLIGVGF